MDGGVRQSIKPEGGPRRRAKGTILLFRHSPLSRRTFGIDNLAAID
jgi:hypothetical protein